MIFHSYVNLPESNPNLDDPNVEPMATKNVTFTFDVVDVPVGTAVDSDTVRQLLRRDPAPTFSQAAILVRSAALGYGTAGRPTNLQALGMHQSRLEQEQLNSLPACSTPGS